MNFDSMLTEANGNDLINKIIALMAQAPKPPRDFILPGTEFYILQPTLKESDDPDEQAFRNQLVAEMNYFDVLGKHDIANKVDQYVWQKLSEKGIRPSRKIVRSSPEYSDYREYFESCNQWIEVNAVYREHQAYCVKMYWKLYYALTNVSAITLLLTPAQQQLNVELWASFNKTIEDAMKIEESNG